MHAKVTVEQKWILWASQTSVKFESRNCPRWFSKNKFILQVIYCNWKEFLDGDCFEINSLVFSQPISRIMRRTVNSICCLSDLTCSSYLLIAQTWSDSEFPTFGLAPAPFFATFSWQKIFVDLILGLVNAYKGSYGRKFDELGKLYFSNAPNNYFAGLLDQQLELDSFERGWYQIYRNKKGTNDNLNGWLALNLGRMIRVQVFRWIEYAWNWIYCFVVDVFHPPGPVARLLAWIRNWQLDPLRFVNIRNTRNVYQSRKWLVFWLLNVWKTQQVPTKERAPVLIRATELRLQARRRITSFSTFRYDFKAVTLRGLFLPKSKKLPSAFDIGDFASKRVFDAKYDGHSIGSRSLSHRAHSPAFDKI